MHATPRRRTGVLVTGIACLAVLGCESSLDGGGLGFDSIGDAPIVPGAGAPGGGGTGGTGSGPMDGDSTLPPEVETTIDLAQPQASERFVYAANPEGGTVVIIDAQSLAIQTLETGTQPTYLRTLAGTDDAIVLNLGSDDATIIRDPAGGASTSSLPVVPGANAIAVTPDGKHAVVWFDSSQPGATSGSGSFQDVTVLFLEAGDDGAVDMTVGFRPRSVFFSNDGESAYVVNEDGVSILEFARVRADGSHVARLVSLGADIDQQSADVAVTPNGQFALARDPAASELRLVDLDDGRIRTIDVAELPRIVAIQKDLEAALADGEDAGAPLLPAVEVTDLDLAASGAFALAALRNQSAVVRIPIPGGFEDAGSAKVVEVSGTVTGSVTLAPTSDRALLYTTATIQERITILDLDDDSLRPIALRKSVEAVAFAPDGETALIVNKKLDGNPNDPGLDPDVVIDRSYGYSVLRLDSDDVKLQVSPTRPGSFALLSDSSFLFMAFRDDAKMLREVHQVDMTSFLVTLYPLGSPPIGLGAVPSVSRVFVSQDHPDGRITLIDWTTGEARTVTGFELNSRIRD